MPLCASASPSAGDTNLASSFLQQQEAAQIAGDVIQCLRLLLRGTDTKFPLLVGDAGFEHLAPNMNNAGRILLKDVCQAEGALFTSTKKKNEIFVRDNALHTISEEEVDDLEENQTRIQNKVKKTRELRHANEQVVLLNHKYE